MRLLTPTENHRLNELCGFLGLTMGLLVALSLLSYNPHDASLNVSSFDAGARHATNWIGPVGAHGADLLFQGLGYAAFLLPAGIFALGTRWFRSRPVDSPTAKLVGWGLFVLGLPALVSLWHFPEVRGAAPPGGLLGDVLASGLTAAFNSVGGQLVTVAALLVALFLTTKFFFLGAQEWAKGPLAKINFIPAMMERYNDWREAREQKQLRKRVEDIKISGRPAVASQVKEAISKVFAKSAVAEAERRGAGV